MKRKRIKVSCRDVVRHVGEDLAQLAEEAMYARIRRHLDTCPNCDAYIDSLRKVIKLYRRYPDPKLGTKARRRPYKIIPLTH